MTILVVQPSATLPPVQPWLDNKLHQNQENHLLQIFGGSIFPRTASYLMQAAVGHGKEHKVRAKEGC